MANSESIGQIQSGLNIFNEGASLEEVDYVANEMMDKAYQAEDIIRFVNENPNLSFVYFGMEQKKSIKIPIGIKCHQM